jgi:hypothetical protein
MTSGRSLSKSRYLIGLQCAKRLWWTVNEPDAPELAVETNTVALDRGRQLGELARAHLPGGVLIDMPPWEIDSRVAATAKALDDGASVIKPLLDQVEDPPTAKTLQGIMNIAVVVWNLPLYEKAKHANAATFRAGLESALANMPAQGKATIAAIARARLTTYAADPSLAFAEVVTEPSGKAEVRATAFLLDRPPGARGQA